MQDFKPVEIRSSNTVLRASRARILIVKGDDKTYVYIAKSTNSVKRYELVSAVEDSERSRKKMTIRRDGFDSEITFWKDGCGTCGYSLGRVATKDLIAAAQ